jgi:glycosyltransferase involved in cell wall biosynthesis
MNPRGGTEILHGKLQQYVPDIILNKINLVISDCNPELLSTTKHNVLWQHVNTDQRVASNLQDKNYQAQISKFVFVSDWQRQKFNHVFGTSLDKSIVLLNACDEVAYKPKTKTSKLKLIYTSTPWRGLEILLESFKLLNRNDIELDVYSSTVIYGIDFMKNQYDWLWNKCRATPGVNYRGYATNKGIHRALENSHILAYPSIFEETSCLAAIEAGCHGLEIVTTDLAALPETCGSLANYVKFTTDYKKLILDYAAALNNAIDNYWQQQEKLYSQSLWFNLRYNWTNRALEWENLINELVK